jgi:hypothetical protein
MSIYFLYHYAGCYKGEKFCQLPRLHTISGMKMKCGYVTLVEQYLQVETKILGVKLTHCHCPPQVNPTCTDLGSDLGLHSEWPVANHPSDGIAGGMVGAFKKGMSLFVFFLFCIFYL